MKRLLWTGLTVGLLFATALPLPARKRSHRAAETKPQPNQTEAATRLQVFLDRANFSPGAITGRYNDFTSKALSLYRESRGEPQPSSPAKTRRPISIH
jgi:hypothetical protein